MTNLLAEFGRHEHRAMVVAALELLSSFADSETARNQVLAPWAWDLHQRARRLEGRAAREAKAIARVVHAAALGELTSADLSAAAAAIDVDRQDLLAARGVLRIAMNG